MREIRHPDQTSSAYFIGKSDRLFIALGIAVLAATIAYFADDHLLHERDHEGKSVVCLTGIMLNSITIGFLALSAIFLVLRLYYSFWKGRVCSAMVILQIGVLFPVLLTVFTRMFSFPGLLFSKGSEVSIAVSNLFALYGFLFAGLATYKLLKIVNANLNLP
jgi:hypothetical protein